MPVRLRPADPALDQRIRAACERTGARFHAAGEHPGFMFERLATSITALSQRVDRITVQEFVDVSRVPAQGMLTDLMGMGRQPTSVAGPRWRDGRTIARAAPA